MKKNKTNPGLNTEIVFFFWKDINITFTVIVNSELYEITFTLFVQPTLTATLFTHSLRSDLISSLALQFAGEIPNPSFPKIVHVSQFCYYETVSNAYVSICSWRWNLCFDWRWWWWFIYNGIVPICNSVG